MNEDPAVYMPPLGDPGPGMRWEPACPNGNTGHLRALCPGWWPVAGASASRLDDEYLVPDVNGNAPAEMESDQEGAVRCDCPECSGANIEDPICGHWSWWRLLEDQPAVVTIDPRAPLSQTEAVHMVCHYGHGSYVWRPDGAFLEWCPGGYQEPAVAEVWLQGRTPVEAMLSHQEALAAEEGDR